MRRFTQEVYGKIQSFIMKNLYKDINIKNLLHKCEQYGDLVLIGGAIKDIGFFNRIPKDYDFIVIKNGSCADFQLNLDNTIYQTNRNSFGGYKIKYKNFLFDIWTCDNMDDIINKNLKFNLDGLYINLTQGVYYDSLFNQGLKEGVCQLVNKKIKHPDKNRDMKRGMKLAKDFNVGYSKYMN